MCFEVLVPPCTAVPQGLFNTSTSSSSNRTKDLAEGDFAGIQRVLARRRRRIRRAGSTDLGASQRQPRFAGLAAPTIDADLAGASQFLDLDMV